MKRFFDFRKWLPVIGSYLLVAVLASTVTMFLANRENTSKLDQLQSLLKSNFIGTYDQTAIEDAAAAGMISATGDRWSYYVPASRYESLLRSKENRGDVGIGITISANEAGGFTVGTVNPDGPAGAAGVLPGDVLIGVEGQDVTSMTVSQLKQIMQGEENTQVEITVLRDQQELSFTLTRMSIPVIVAEGEMLENAVGLVTIYNFNDKCAAETIAAIDALVEQGAKALVFDVRDNPGGRASELVAVLDHLLPKGQLFRMTEKGKREKVETSDARCIELPMAVIVNGSSYSAAEFFAAALSEYEWATLVGEQTVGKSYFQYTYVLKDGSAVALSSGKYYTPNGVSLSDVGGLTPDVQISLSEEEAMQYACGQLPPEADPQIRAAIESLNLS